MNISNSKSLQVKSTTLHGTFRFCICLAVVVATNANLLAQYNGSFGDIRRVAGLDTLSGQQFANEISDDGLTLWLTSYNGSGSLYQATRSSILDPFDAPAKIDSLNSAGPENIGQTISSDGLTTYFSSGSVGGIRSSIWTAARESREADWSVPKALEIDDDAVRVGFPALSSDDLTMYYSANHGGKDGLFTVSRPSVSETFGDPEPISELNTSSRHQFGPTVSSDELAIVYGEETGFAQVRALIATRPSTDEPFGKPIDLDDFGLGSELNSAFKYLGVPVLSPTWPEDGSKLYFTGNPGGFSLYEATWNVENVLGDFNGDGLLDVGDLEQLTSEVQTGANLQFDLDQSGTVDIADRRYWVTELKSTWIGDANLDGVFDSGDFVDVFGAGKYETGEVARWIEGDWNGDQRFDSGDFVVAFADGGYELGARAAVAAVPEPSGLALLLIGLFGATRVRRIR